MGASPVIFLSVATAYESVTDCIKRCAHQLGVGLHLYSPDGSYQSFRLTRPAADKQKRGS